MSALPVALNRIPIIILDTARSNPFASPQDRVRGVVEAPVGTIVAFATSPGEELIESKGANSFYTTALLEVMKEPGLADRARVQESTAPRP